MNDDAGVIEARLHYQCGHRGGHHGAVPEAQAGGYSASAPVAPGGIRFRSAVPAGY